jgi:hypothetical protein
VIYSCSIYEFCVSSAGSCAAVLSLSFLKVSGLDRLVYTMKYFRTLQMVGSIDCNSTLILLQVGRCVTSPVYGCLALNHWGQTI